MTTTAHADCGIDNDEVRVTTWTFQPGESTGTHRHELPYVVVPLTDGIMRIDTARDSTQSTLTPGGCYYRQSGAEHNVTNEGARQLVFVEVEIKADAGGAASG